MPRVKLLNAAAQGTTGTVFYLGRCQPPYTIRVEGATVNGVNILTAANRIPGGGPYAGSTAPTSAFSRDYGHIGGEGAIAETEVGELTTLLDKTIATIDHYVHAIRADTGATTAASTVWLEMAG